MALLLSVKVTVHFSFLSGRLSHLDWSGGGSGRSAGLQLSLY